MAIDAAFTHFPRLTTDRLVLRAIQPDDAEALFPVFSDADAMQYYGHLPHQSLAYTQALIAQIQARYAQRAALRWGITRTGDDRVIGSCGFHRFDDGFQRAETGYELQRASWGQGIMAEAMTAILSFGFTKLGLHRVEAIIDDANAPSRAFCSNLASPMRVRCASASTSATVSRTSTSLDCSRTSGSRGRIPRPGKSSTSSCPFVQFSRQSRRLPLSLSRRNVTVSHRC